MSHRCLYLHLTSFLHQRVSLTFCSVTVIRFLCFVSRSILIFEKAKDMFMLWRLCEDTGPRGCPEYISSLRPNVMALHPLKKHFWSHMQVEFSALSCFSGSRHFWTNFMFKLIYPRKPGVPFYRLIPPWLVNFILLSLPLPASRPCAESWQGEAGRKLPYEGPVRLPQRRGGTVRSLLHSL